MPELSRHKTLGYPCLRESESNLRRIPDLRTFQRQFSHSNLQRNQNIRKGSNFTFSETNADTTRRGSREIKLKQFKDPNAPFLPEGFHRTGKK